MEDKIDVLPPPKNRLEKREVVTGDSFLTGSGWATFVRGLEFPLSDPLLLVSRLVRLRYCCLSSSVVNAAPVFLTAEDEPEDSDDALESELADLVDFFKIPPTIKRIVCTSLIPLAHSALVLLHTSMSYYICNYTR